jgi:hypothetical protein
MTAYRILEHGYQFGPARQKRSLSVRFHVLTAASVKIPTAPIVRAIMTDHLPDSEGSRYL